MSRNVWKSAGLHLLAPGPEGWLAVTPDFLRAYLMRAEIHPIEDSCAAEVALHAALMEDPARIVTDDEIAAIADEDAAHNYRTLLAFRERLLDAGTIEGAYLRLVRQPDPRIPLLFLDQLAHLIVANMLRDVADPMRWRAGELLFRGQTVSTEAGRVLLADEEIVDLNARAQGETGLERLLAETGTPLKTVTLDVLGADNAEIYWSRADRFDTVIDLRFGLPALDALARVLETFLQHLLRIEVHLEPRERIEDRDWRWHVGLDAQSTAILNALYQGEDVGTDALARLVALFTMRIADNRLVIDRVRGRPIHLALAMDEASRVRMKPHNLIVNLPLVALS